MTRRLLALIMIDNQGLSSSLQSSDSGTPTISSTSSSASTLTNSDVIALLPLAGPIIAGVLVGIIVIAAIVVICFLQRRPQHPRRRHRSFDAQFILQPGVFRERLLATLFAFWYCVLLLYIELRPHRHSRSRFLRDENDPKNATPKKKYRRYSRRSRYSTRIMELEVRNSVPPIGSRSEARESSMPSGNRKWHSDSNSTNSTFSLTLNTNKIGVNKPHHQVVDASQTSITLVPLTISSNQVEQYSPSTIELPLQPLSLPNTCPN